MFGRGVETCESCLRCAASTMTSVRKESAVCMKPSCRRYCETSSGTNSVASNLGCNRSMLYPEIRSRTRSRSSCIFPCQLTPLNQVRAWTYPYEFINIIIELSLSEIHFNVTTWSFHANRGVDLFVMEYIFEISKSMTCFDILSA